MKMTIYPLRWLLVSAMTFAFLIGTVADAQAQRRKTKKRRSDRTEVRSSREVDTRSFKDKITYELGLGNIFFFNRNFEAGLKAGVGYQLNKVLTAGLGAKYILNIQSNGIDNITSNRFGVYPFVNVKVYDGWYAKGIYEYGRYDQVFQTGGGQLFKETLTTTSPWVGVGRVQGFDQWNFGFEILFPFDNTIRNQFAIIEYWGMFTYNF